MSEPVGARCRTLPAARRGSIAAAAQRHGGDAPSRAIVIRLADDDGTRSSAHLLLNRMYSWRGYGDRHVIPFTPKHTTFTASDETSTVGTVTLAVDSDAGLAADGLFREDLDGFRERGARVCELTKLAFSLDGDSQRVLAAIFHIVFIYGQRRYDCTDLFIEVNPRHRRFYESMLGFRRVGGLKDNPSVGAPSQLMWLPVAQIRARIDERRPEEGGDQRSLYRHFFSAREEEGIYRRLLQGGYPALPAEPERRAA